MENVRSIISYNVNGLRAAIGKGLWEWLEAERPDVLCLQEIKAQPEDVPLLELEALGYRHYWRPAEKRDTAEWPLFHCSHPIMWFTRATLKNMTGRGGYCAPTSATGRF